MRAVIYARVSTEQQAKENKGSIDHQIAACEKTIKDHSWELIMAPFKDIESGREVRGREAFESIITQLWLGNEALPEEVPDDWQGFFGILKHASLSTNARPFDVLVVYDYDRLGRDHADSLAICKVFLKHGIQVYSCNQPVEPDDPQNINIYNDQRVFSQTFAALKSAIEIHSTRRRYWQGMQNKVKRGELPHPASPPYGYQPKVIDLGNGKSRLEIEVNKDEAAVVKQIFELYLENKAYRQIVVHLNDRGIASPGDKLWSPSAVQAILSNPVYAGLVRWQHKRTFFGKRVKQPKSKWLITKGGHEAVIPEEQFWHVQTLIESRKRVKGRASGSSALLSGLAVCAICGNKMWSYQAKSPKANAPSYYVCGRYHTYKKISGKEVCANKFIAMELLDTMVVDKLVKLVSDEELLASIVQDQKTREAKRTEREIETLVSQEKKNRDKLSRLVVAYENGVMDVHMFGERKKKLDDEHRRIQSQKADLSTQMLWHKGKDAAVAKLQRIADLRNDLSSNKDALRATILSLVDQVKVHRTAGANVYDVEVSLAV